MKINPRLTEPGIFFDPLQAITGIGPRHHDRLRQLTKTIHRSFEIKFLNNYHLLPLNSYFIPILYSLLRFRLSLAKLPYLSRPRFAAPSQQISTNPSQHTPFHTPRSRSSKHRKASTAGDSPHSQASESNAQPSLAPHPIETHFSPRAVEAK